MLYFWLAASILTTIIVTIMGFVEGFDRWSLYYVFAGMSTLMYLFKRWMMKRMQRHMEYLEQQKESI
jgi:predicted Co/Zn/Cd cation transporter (cation efflux family)